MVEITSEEQNKVKRMKRTEDTQRPLGQYQMHQHLNYLCTRRRREQERYEKIFEEIIVENFPNMEKEIIKFKRHEVPYRINPRRNTPRHILIKLTETKHKERILKTAREKQHVTYKGNPICLTADLSAETLQARREWQDIFKSTEREKSTTKITVPGKDLIQN